MDSTMKSYMFASKMDSINESEFPITMEDKLYNTQFSDSTYYD